MPKSFGWAAILVVVTLLAGCEISHREPSKLREFYRTARRTDIVAVTATICQAPIRKERREERFRRWGDANPALAEAIGRARFSPRNGWTAAVPAGTYRVPPSLCDQVVTGGKKILVIASIAGLFIIFIGGTMIWMHGAPRRGRSVYTPNLEAQA